MQIIMKIDQITWSEKEESNFKNQNPESGYIITLKKLCTGHRVLEVKFQVIYSDEMLKYLGIIWYWSWNTWITFLTTMRRFLPTKMQIKYKNSITFFHRYLQKNNLLLRSSTFSLVYWKKKIKIKKLEPF